MECQNLHYIPRLLQKIENERELLMSMVTAMTADYIVILLNSHVHGWSTQNLATIRI